MILVGILLMGALEVFGVGNLEMVEDVISTLFRFVELSS